MAACWDDIMTPSCHLSLAICNQGHFTILPAWQLDDEGHAVGSSCSHRGFGENPALQADCLECNLYNNVMLVFDGRWVRNFPYPVAHQ